jgi:hypothetical protein
MSNSIYVSPFGLVDEGVEQALENVQTRAGLDAVSVAVVYHAARDVFPHGRERKVRYFGEGSFHFRPQRALYEGQLIQPEVSDLAREVDVLPAAIKESERRGMEANAWVVFLHRDRPQSDHPCVTRNAFGDPYLTDLCPSHPATRAYVVALAADVAGRGVSTVVAESLHFHPFQHGFHHERCFVNLGALGSFLLGVCFCEHCMAAAARMGVAAAAVKRFVAQHLEGIFSGEAVSGDFEELERQAVGGLLDGELGGYLAARVETVSSLAADATEAARSAGAHLRFIDLSGGVKGYASGRPTGAPAVSTAWELGIDAQQLGCCCDSVEVVAYAADPARIRTELAAYAELCGHEASLAVALRPTLPDTRSAEELVEKVAVAKASGVEAIDFYHYDLMRLQSLDWIREALTATASRD